MVKMVKLIPIGCRIVTLVLLALHFIDASYAQGSYPNESFIHYIQENIPSKQEIDVFVNEPGWVKFDPETGYILNGLMRHDGMDNSHTIVSSRSNGSRTSYIYANRPCRINTYGDSFTQGSQVNDGETWQEYLAAHLGEPIRNYGVGGLGTYQAYRRMLREELTADSAEYLILYIWGDDHLRSLLRCRYMLTKEWHLAQYQKNGIGKVFHGNFWANIEMDLETGRLVEKESLIQDPAKLHLMTDPEWMAEHLKEDLAMQMWLYIRGNIPEIDTGAVSALSKCLNVEMNLQNKETLREQVSRVLYKYGFAATKYIVDQTLLFADAHDRKVLFLLFDPYKATRSLIEDEERFDQEIVDYLNENHIPYFDMNPVHAADFNSFKLSLEAYYERYFIGHYNPAGNHFFAFALKDKIVEWLDPKPITYLGTDSQGMDFENYLEGIITNQ
jgi:hypothetical protein